MVGSQAQKWHRAGLALAVGLPLVLYVLTCSAHAYWLDAGEFVAASVGLGVAHPPGHPLALLVGKIASLLPFGALPLRVAVGQALCAAAAAGFAYVAFERTARTAGMRDPRAAVAISVGATWLIATSYGWWFQAVRPEVYALQALVLCAAMERIVACETTIPPEDARPLYGAALAYGLGMANHHLTAVLALSFALPAVVRMAREARFRTLGRATAFGAVGLSTYVYLPVRAATDPAINLGDPVTPARMAWVVSARAYSHNVGFDAVRPPLQRLAEIPLVLATNLHLVALFLAVAGMYVAIRHRPLRRLGPAWIGLALVSLSVPACLVAVRPGNPDVHGYLLAGHVALGALAVVFLAVVVELARARLRRPWVAFGLAVLVAGGGLAYVPSAAARAALTEFHATDDFDAARRHAVPARTVLFVHLPQTVFREWSVRATDRVDPDLTVVPLPFLTYPGVADRLLDREPGLREVVRGYLERGMLPRAALLRLASRRPVRVEMDVRVPPSLYDVLRPAGLWYAVAPDRPAPEAIRRGARTQRAAYGRLYATWKGRPHDPATRDRLLWRHYTDALYYTGVGARRLARDAVGHALELQPRSRTLRRLDAALRQAPAGASLDVRRFTIGRPPPPRE